MGGVSVTRSSSSSLRGVTIPKLNQIIAIQPTKKSLAKDALTVAYHQIQKPDLLSGIARHYKPKDELGESLPAESKHVQTKVQTLIEQVERALLSQDSPLAVTRRRMRLACSFPRPRLPP